MPMGGKSKPVVLRRLEGDPNRKRTEIEEPKPTVSTRAPQAPAYLPAIAKKEWKRVAGELHRLGLLTTLDLKALEAYCHSYSVFVEAAENLQKHGVLIKAQSGFPIQSPYLGILNKASDKMHKWLSEFGMTPSSRTRLAVDQGNKKKAKGQSLLT